MKIKDFLVKNKLVFIVVLAYVGLLIFAPAKAATAFLNSTYYLKEMAQIMPVIFLLTVVIEVLLPKELIIRGLGRGSGIKGNLLSLALGSLSAGPIYAAFPISKSLLGKGASLSNIVIILSSWAVIKVPMLANEAKFLGTEFMVKRWFLTVGAIFILAYLLPVIIKKQSSEKENKKIAGFAVKKEYCIGCALCSKEFPEIFYMEGKKAFVKLKREDSFISGIKMIDRIIERCPSRAIVYENE